ncbi:MAG: energy-coupling factor transporter transmembrane component T, partial [Desulfobacterales bacterium]
AQLNAFGYRPGRSALHGLDVRFKFFALFMLMLTAMNCGTLPLAVMSLISASVARRLGLSLRGIFAELRYFLLLLGLVFAAKAFSTPGAPLPDMLWLPVSREGMQAGAVTVWRLFLVVFFGLLFVATTRAAAIKAAVVWFLQPFPRLPAQRIGTMLGLVLRFIPLVFLQAGATIEAQRARGIESRRNPFYRLTCFVIPFLRRLFLSADRFTEAMEARCYTETRTDPLLSARPRDWWILGGVAGTVGLLWLM